MRTRLHLGMQKTGSKALQHVLANNAGALAAEGLEFSPQLRDGLWHRPMMDAGPSAVRAALESARQAHTDRGLDPVFSYEELYLLPDEVVAVIGEQGGATALLFVRDPVDWASSFFNQLIKAHRVTYDTVVGFEVTSEEVVRPLDVTRHLQRWSDRLGADAVEVHPYDESTDTPRVFLGWLGIADLSAFQIPEAVANPGADLPSLRVMLEVKRLVRGLGDERLVAVMNRAHQALRPRWQASRAGQRTRLLSDGETAWLEERFGGAYRSLVEQGSAGASTAGESGADVLVVPRSSLADLSRDEAELARRIVGS